MKFMLVYRRRDTGQIWQGDWRKKDASDAILKKRHFHSDIVYRIRCKLKEPAE